MKPRWPFSPLSPASPVSPLSPRGPWGPWKGRKRLGCQAQGAQSTPGCHASLTGCPNSITHRHASSTSRAGGTHGTLCALRREKRGLEGCPLPSGGGLNRLCSEHQDSSNRHLSAEHHHRVTILPWADYPSAASRCCVRRSRALGAHEPLGRCSKPLPALRAPRNQALTAPLWLSQLLQAGAHHTGGGHCCVLGVAPSPLASTHRLASVSLFASGTHGAGSAGSAGSTGSTHGAGLAAVTLCRDKGRVRGWGGCEGTKGESTGLCSPSHRPRRLGRGGHRSRGCPAGREGIRT